MKRILFVSSILITAQLGFGQVTSTGTTNYVPLFINSNQIGNSSLYQLGSRIGIGTTVPTNALDVNGTGRFRAMIEMPTYTDFTFNAYYDGSWKYRSNGYASDFYQTLNGDIVFLTAPSGSADGALAFTNRFTISNTGNVGIGTTSLDDQLSIKVNSNNYDRILGLTRGTNDWHISIGGSDGLGFANVNNSLMPLYMLNNGNVGIGTTTPGTKLTVSGSEQTNKISQEGGTYTEIAQRTWDGGAAMLFSAYTPSTYVSGHMPVLGNTKNKFNANVFGAPSHGPGMIYFGGNQGAMEFYVGPQSSGANTDVVWGDPQLRIQRNGNVGIGTPSPNATLHVHHPTSPVLNVRNDGTYQATVRVSSNRAQFGSTNSSAVDILGGTATPVVSVDAAAGNLDLFSNKMRITSVGNVGIGTTNPQKQLDIVSTANDFVTVGARTLGIGQWTGIHFGYREENNLYRKAAIVFERKDEVGNGADGTIHILNDGTNTSSNADLNDARLSIRSNGNIGIGTTTGINEKLVVNGNINIPSGNRMLFGGAAIEGYVDSYPGLKFYGKGGGYDHLAMTVDPSGNVIVGQQSSIPIGYILNVWGKVRANEVVVNTTGSDFVFEEEYALRSIDEVEKFVKENKHLPEIPSAKEMQEKGVGVSELQTKLLQKIEELTLYVIELKRENKELKKQVNTILEQAN